MTSYLLLVNFLTNRINSFTWKGNNAVFCDFVDYEPLSEYITVCFSSVVQYMPFFSLMYTIASQNKHSIRNEMLQNHLGHHLCRQHRVMGSNIARIGLWSLPTAFKTRFTRHMPSQTYRILWIFARKMLLLTNDQRPVE